MICVEYFVPMFRFYEYGLFHRLGTKSKSRPNPGSKLNDSELMICAEYDAELVTQEAAVR